MREVSVRTLVNPQNGRIARYVVLALPFVLIFLAVVPDSLSYPGLRVVVSERFARSDFSTQFFTLASLVGALLALPLIAPLRRYPIGRVILVAGVLQGIVIGAMAAPVSWWGLLVLRTVQGGFDLLTLAILTGAAVRATGGTGRTFGIIGSVIMAGLACGFAFGGIVAGVAPSLIFPLASILALLLGLGGLVFAVMSSNEHAQLAPKKATSAQTRMVGLACNAGDRFLAGVSTVILPLLLAGAFGISTGSIGLIMGVPLFMAVFGGLLAGILVDAVGVGRVRAVGCAIYGGGLLLLVTGSGDWTYILIATIAMGLGVTAILPTALLLGTQSDASGRDPAVIARIQAGGQGGYIVGVLGAAGMTAYLGQATSGIIVLAVGLYFVWNGFWLVLAWQVTNVSSRQLLTSDAQNVQDGERASRVRRVLGPGKASSRPVPPRRRSSVTPSGD